MLSIPEALLLFALHDDKGTVQPAAFLALDHALRGALLCELRCRGYLQTKVTGEVRITPSPPPPPPESILSTALAAVGELDLPAPAGDALDAVQRALPDLRDDLVGALADRGILSEAHVERMGLPDDVVHPMANAAAEARARGRLREALTLDDDVQPRWGSLLALCAAAHLESDLFPADHLEQVSARADWVAERDAIVRAVRAAVELVEGW